jgi:hypothetical protein
MIHLAPQLKRARKISDCGVFDQKGAGIVFNIANFPGNNPCIASVAFFQPAETLSTFKSMDRVEIPYALYDHAVIPFGNIVAIVLPAWFSFCSS